MGHNRVLYLQGDTEVFSCYYSASHTDNISTDEHDSIKENSTKLSAPIDDEQAVVDATRGLHSSDSGADLTEYSRSECDIAFLKFWHDNQEQIIINSWIAQYSAYINPDFMQQNPHLFNSSQSGENKAGPSSVWQVEASEKARADPPAKSETTEFAFTLSKIQENEILTDIDHQKRTEVTHRNQMLVRNLSGSESMDRLNTEISAEGWNMLQTPVTELDNETERLLNSRCGSHASSSVRTVDSLTNVTRMTVSSIDFNDSSKTSDSISSVSSVQSSLSSSSSEDIEDNLDYDQQWQYLWKKNYEEQYNAEYNKFISTWYDKQSEGRTCELYLNVYFTFLLHITQVHEKFC